MGSNLEIQGVNELQFIEMHKESQLVSCLPQAKIEVK
jgi:hypothetical protein